MSERSKRAWQAAANIWIPYLAALSAIISAGIFIAGLGACSTISSPAPTFDSCRQEAREAFAALMGNNIDETEAQARVDEGCAGISPSDRKAIVDSERDRSIARYLSGNASESDS